MKHGPGVTSAVDIIAPKPAARPEPSAKAASRDEDRASFADALDAETSEPEAAPAKEAGKETTAKDEPATPDANAAAQLVQPQQPQPTPAVNSPEAILAGLTQAVPTDAPTAEVGAAPPAIDAAAAAGAAQSAGKAATPQPAAPLADAAATPAATEETGEVAAASNTAAKKPAAAPGTPTATTAAPADEAAPLAASGEERTSATIETATTNNKATATTTSTAIDPTASKAQGADAKATQAAVNTTTDVAPAAKADTPAPTTTATPVDALVTSRSATETARAAQSNPAMQNAPATTVQVYQRMVERFDGRAQRYEIRLDPAELGRVDVRIEVGADKKVHAVLAAHDSAALTDLMRGQRSLERALNDAGIDLAKDGIRFELSSDQNRNSANNFNDKDGNARSANVWRGFNTVDVAVDAQTAAAARPWRSQRLDVVA